MPCFTFQSVTLYSNFQEVTCHNTNGKGVMWVKKHKCMTTTQKVRGAFLKFVTYLQILLFLSNWSVVHLFQKIDVEVNKMHIFCRCHTFMTPKISDWMNLAVIQDPRDHDPEDPRIQSKELFSFQINWITWIFIQKSKQIGF